MKRHLPPIPYGKRRAFKLSFSIFLTLILFSLVNVLQRVSFTGNLRTTGRKPLIFVVTPTYKRTTRLADMTRLANTLMHINDIHWIVVEDGDSTFSYVERILERSEVSYTYVAHRTKAGYPRRGWWQRNMAMKFIRENSTYLLQPSQEGVVYFADDDNSYDLRLFNDYIRNVKTVGMWAVGLVGGTAIETPRVVDGKVVGFSVKWNPNRVFAIDMAGFAINLKILLNSTADFTAGCKRGLGAPETCLLQDLGLSRSDIEPFGITNQTSKDILVWHTKTKTPMFDPKKIDTYGYVVEFGSNKTVGVPVKKKQAKRIRNIGKSMNSTLT